MHKEPGEMPNSDYFTKDLAGQYIDISPQSAIAVGMEGGRYHRDMAITDEHMGWDSEMYHSVRREDFDVFRTGKTSTSVAYLKGSDDIWRQSTVVKSMTDDGHMHGVCHLVEIKLLYGGWAAHLDFEAQVLRLPDGPILNRADLRLLHRLLIGMPRKVMADIACVSVKAIEKRLTRIRAKLTRPGCDCHNLQGVLNERHLMEFIISDPDWFSLTTTHTVYPG